MELTSRQRLSAIVRHEQADRLPWAPKFNTWFQAHLRRGDMPDMLRDCEDWYDAARLIGVDIFDKCGAVYREVRSSVKVVEEQDGPRSVVRYITPIGELYTIRQEVEDYAHSLYVTKYPITSLEDIRIYRYMLEDTIYEPCYEHFMAAEARIGDDGITMTNLPDSPLHRIFVGLMGYEVGTYAIMDAPSVMDALCDHILEKNEEAYEVAMASPAEVLLTGENTNADFESPSLFRRYAFPTFKRGSELAHAHGKLHWIHACGKLKVLLPQFFEAGIDGVESLTPPPYADTPLWEAQAAWQGKITIDGGISPHILVERLAPGELEAYVKDLFRRMAPGHNFVLSVSDDTPTDAILERILRIGELVREYDKLPIDPDRFNGQGDDAHMRSGVHPVSLVPGRYSMEGRNYD